MVKDQSSAEQQTIEKKLLKRFALNVRHHFPCLKKAILALVLEGVTSQPRAKVMTPAAKTYDLAMVNSSRCRSYVPALDERKQ